MSSLNFRPSGGHPSGGETPLAAPVADDQVPRSLHSLRGSGPRRSLLDAMDPEQAADPENFDSGFSLATAHSLPALEKKIREAEKDAATARPVAAEALSAGPSELPTSTPITNDAVRAEAETVHAFERDQRGRGYDYSVADYYAMVKLAFSMQASDLHLRAGYGAKVRHKLDLKAFKAAEYTKPCSAQSIMHFLENLVGVGTDGSAMAIFRSQGWVDFSFTQGDVVVRGNGYREYNGVCLSLRFFYRQHSDLGFLELRRMEEFLTRPSGLIMITGPTGSAKTTTASAMIDFLNSTFPYHILTMEDPVEYVYMEKRSRITQRSIPVDVADFDSGLKSALRQDPDVIFVGEMRDLPVMRKVLHAAETGHLVITTMHADSVIQSFQRIIMSFPSGEQAFVRATLANLFTVVLNQRLLPRIDGDGLVLGYELWHPVPALTAGLREGNYIGWDHTMHSSPTMVQWDERLDELKKRNLISRETWKEYLRDEDRRKNS
jgi:twitching motility protein PilT